MEVRLGPGAKLLVLVSLPLTHTLWRPAGIALVENLAVPNGPPAIILEELGQGRPIFSGGLAEVRPDSPDTRGVWPTAGEQHRPRRRAECELHVSVAECESVVGQLLEIGRLHVVAPIWCHLRPHVVCCNEQNVMQLSVSSPRCGVG